MHGWQETFEVEALGTDALHVVIPPRNLEEFPMRVLTFENEAGGAALAAVEIAFGPTEAGPWATEDLSTTGIPTLAAGSVAVWRGTRYDRCLRVRAQAAVVEGKSCSLKLHLDALPA